MAEFSNVSKIQYEGSDSKNPLAFRYYNPDELVEGKKMKDHLRFSCAFWHTMCMNGSDQFGMPTMSRPWDDGSNSVKTRKNAFASSSNSSKKWGSNSTPSTIEI